MRRNEILRRYYDKIFHIHSRGFSIELENATTKTLCTSILSGISTDHSKYTSTASQYQAFLLGHQLVTELIDEGILKDDKCIRGNKQWAEIFSQVDELRNKGLAVTIEYPLCRGYITAALRKVW